MGDYAQHPGVDAYLEALPDWQRAICADLRDLIHAAEPDIEETVKRRVQPYFVLDRNVCALLAAKDHVNLFLYDGLLVIDPDHIITGGHENTTARTIAFHRDSAVPQEPLTAMLRQICANNRAGGWRKIKKDQGPGAPSLSPCNGASSTSSATGRRSGAGRGGTPA